jgi:secreted PhoX family phosphatase
MKQLFSYFIFSLLATSSFAQIQFDPRIQPEFNSEVVVMPPSPLKTQIIFIGGYDMVEATATYGQPRQQVVSKDWNDFIGFTPDTSGQYLGWISINHEKIVANDHLGDGGGMTTFLVDRDPNTDSIVVVNQTLADGRSGLFFNVDFVNHTGETGMNCGGISSSIDGRIWTAEEWFRGDNEDIADRDTSMFTIGVGTANGQLAPAGFPGFNGNSIQKYQNYNYMTEIDPRQAVAIRKQYNWGRQAFEGGVIMPDNRTVFLNVDNTPAFFTKFVADQAGDFTVGKTYVYKHDAVGSKWLEIDNTNLSKMLNFADEAVALGATMYNRLEWIAKDPNTNLVYLTETGRDNPASRWADESAAGAVHAPHTLNRAQFVQGTHPDSSDYWDYYGRVLQFDPLTDEMTVFLEGGPYFANSPDSIFYPYNHLSNPDGLNFLNVNGQSYMIICEDLNGTSRGRVPNGFSDRTCELYLFDMSDPTPTVSDLSRISIAPRGAEITGAVASPDGKTIFVNSQHPSTSNPFPYDHSLTYAITGWDESLTAIQQAKKEQQDYDFYPNPVARTLYFKEVGDFAIYDLQGRRLEVHRNVNQIEVAHLPAGTYFIQNQGGVTKKLVVQ